MWAEGARKGRRSDYPRKTTEDIMEGSHGTPPSLYEAGLWKDTSEMWQCNDTRLPHATMYLVFVIVAPLS